LTSAHKNDLKTSKKNLSKEKNKFFFSKIFLKLKNIKILFSLSLDCIGNIFQPAAGHF
jgi:hypothetical protein